MEWSFVIFFRSLFIFRGLVYGHKCASSPLLFRWPLGHISPFFPLLWHFYIQRLWGEHDIFLWPSILLRLSLRHRCYLSLSCQPHVFKYAMILNWILMTPLLWVVWFMNRLSWDLCCSMEAKFLKFEITVTDCCN